MSRKNIYSQDIDRQPLWRWIEVDNTSKKKTLQKIMHLIRVENFHQNVVEIIAYISSVLFHRIRDYSEEKGAWNHICMVGVAFKSRKWKLFALTYKINKFKKSRDEKVLQDSTFQILDFTIPDKKTNHQEEVWVVGWRSENFQMSTKHQFFFQLFTGDQRRRLKWKRFQTCNYKRHEIEKRV